MSAGDLTQKQRDKLPDSAFCGRGRSFPVLSRADIKPAVNSMGRAADDAERAQIKACLIRKAKQFGWVGSLPQAWQDELKGGKKS
jgi:hypothetical protein